jgi:formamidopyrimidine-DNA glycosylase
MPELPEVETIRKQLGRVLVGQRIKKVEVKREKSFKGSVKQVVGKKIIGIGRKAKLLVMGLSGRLNLLIHLKMTGQLVYQRQGGRRVIGGHPTRDWVGELPSKHTRVIFELDKGRLFFNDMRVFGWVKVVDRTELEKELEKYGPDVIDKGLGEDKFFELLQKSGRAVKLVIMDQSKMGGVGNIYANEGLWCAQVKPQRVAKELDKKEASRLLECLRQVVEQGIKYGGATASDDNYVNALGLGGKYQEHFLVYEQEGKKCQRRGCQGRVKKVKLGGRGTYFCPKCQF